MTDQSSTPAAAQASVLALADQRVATEQAQALADHYCADNDRLRKELEATKSVTIQNALFLIESYRKENDRLVGELDAAHALAESRLWGGELANEGRLQAERANAALFRAAVALLRAWRDAQAGLADTNAVFDVFGVPAAGACDDAECKTKTGHRARSLTKQFRAMLNTYQLLEDNTQGALVLLEQECDRLSRQLAEAQAALMAAEERAQTLARLVISELERAAPVNIWPMDKDALYDAAQAVLKGDAQ